MGGINIKKATVCIFVSILVLLSSVVTTSGAILSKESSLPMLKENIQYDYIGKIFNDLQINLDKVTTKQDALVLVNKVIEELNEHDMLPKGVSEKQVQRLVTRCFLKLDFLKHFQGKNGNETGNTNCLVIGFANETFFRPFPTIYDIPIVHYLAFNTSFLDYNLQTGVKA